MKTSILVFFLGLTSFGALLTSCEDKAGDQSEVKASEEDGTEMATGTTDETKDPQTLAIENMHDAYKGETTAHFKYAAYSKKAAEEGHPEIALLFKAASGAELIHANNHKVVLIRMGEAIPEITPEFTVKSTAENLQESIEGESYEFNTMYPEFIKNANAASNYMAQISFTYAYKVEQKHRDFYIEALAALEAGKDGTLATIYYLCPTCGNTYATTAPSRCEISMTDSKLFIQVTSL
jgi:rubrerythrin